MFCRKCGNTIPDDSNFCPKCGTCNNIDIKDETSNKVNLQKPSDSTDTDNNSAPNINQLKVIEPDLKCPKCGKPIMWTWAKCMYCGAFNPFNTDLQPTINPTTIVTPPPQVIIKEERVVVHETPKEEKGCSAVVGEIIGWIILISIIIGGIQSCLGGG